LKFLFVSEYYPGEDSNFSGSHLQVYEGAKLCSHFADTHMVAFTRGRPRSLREGSLKITLLPYSPWEVVRFRRMLTFALKLSPDAVYARGRTYHLAVATALKLLKGSAVVWGINAQEGYRYFKYLRDLMNSERPLWRKVLLVPLFLTIDLTVAVGMRTADLITVQNDVQRERVERKFPGKRVVVVPNIHTPPSIPRGGRGRYFVWAAANPSPIKRPEVFVKLAEALPDLEFVMVGHIPEAPPPNLTARPRMRREELLKLLAGARATVITSRSEGVPNLAVESMLLGTPVVSLGNDFGILRGVGPVVGDFRELVESVRKLSEDDILWSDLSRRAEDFARRRFVEEARRAWEDICGALGRG